MLRVPRIIREGNRDQISHDEGYPGFKEVARDYYRFIRRLGTSKTISKVISNFFCIKK